MKICYVLNFLIVFLPILGCDKAKRDAEQGSVTISSEPSSAQIFIQKPWHDINGLEIEPFSLPSIRLDQIAGIKNGDSVTDIESACGFRPFKFYQGANFRILFARSSTGEVYEVAFLIIDDSNIMDVSYRKAENEPTRQ